MNNDYLDNQDKYLYGVCRGDSVEDAYDSTYYYTIKQALLAAIPCLTEYSPAEVKIAVCERGDLFKPSECNAFDGDGIADLLDKSNEMLCDELTHAKLFDLSYEEIQELRKLINNFLDQKIDTTGYYRVGKFIEVITLTSEQYTKYL